MQDRHAPGRSFPPPANLLQRPQPIGWIRAPHTVGQLSGDGLLDAISIRSKTLLHLHNNRGDLIRRPAMPPFELFTHAVQVEMKFNRPGAPSMNCPVDNGGLNGVIGPTYLASRRLANGLDCSKVGFSVRRRIGRNGVKKSRSL